MDLNLSLEGGMQTEELRISPVLLGYNGISFAETKEALPPSFLHFPFNAKHPLRARRHSKGFHAQVCGC